MTGVQTCCSSDLEQIVENVFSNAIRYGRLAVEIRAQVGSDFELTVEDHGRGVSPAFVPRLFDFFSRSEESEGTAPGLGLGLAVARAVAREYGGDLTYEDGNPGARFRLTLPRTLAGGVAPPGRTVMTQVAIRGIAETPLQA